MIVSDLESFVLRLLLGGVLDADSRGAINARTDEHVNALLEWCSAPGVTASAQREIDAGGEVRKL